MLTTLIHFLGPFAFFALFAFFNIHVGMMGKAIGCAVVLLMSIFVFSLLVAIEYPAPGLGSALGILAGYGAVFLFNGKPWRRRKGLRSL